MKNILKKIGLIGIIIGVLSPFISLPSVNADNNCRHYLNQYLFLDEINGISLLKDFVDEGKTNYATFMYTFPNVSNTNVKIEIVKSDEVMLSTREDINNFYSNYTLLVNSEEDENINSNNIVKFGNWNTYEDLDNLTVTSVIHGYWGVADNDSDAKKVYWKNILTGEGALNTNTKFYNATIQKKLSDKNHDIEELFSQNFGGATLSALSSNGSFSEASSTYAENLEAFLNKIVSDVNSGNENNSSFTRKYVLKNNNNELFFNANIKRTFNENEAERLIYGFRQDGKYYVVTDNADNYSNENSYDGAIKFINEYKDYIDANPSNQDIPNAQTLCVESEGCYIVEVNNSSTIDIFLYDTYYWPAVYNVEYKVCNTDGTPIEDQKWDLIYDRGVSTEEAVNVTNMPDKKTGITGTTVTLDTKIPEREKYVFKSWCTKEDGKGSCVEAGKTFENKEMINKTLFAYWEESGTVDNEKQGVMSYVIGFACVGLIAYGLYYAINKKNLFKQI